MVYDSRQYLYRILEIALDGARTNVAQGLTKKINTLTVITVNTGTLSIKLNNNTADSIDLSDHLKVEGIPISEIYITNTAQVGITAKIFIAWIDP